MRATPQPLKRLLLLGLVALVSLAACGGGDDGADTATDAGGGVTPAVELFSTDIEQVCAGGTVAAAAPYDPSADAIHPMLAFEGAAPELTEMTLDFPEGWVAQFPDVEKTELVACLDRTKETFVKTCEGYKSDESDETFSVQLYDAEYDVTLYAAQSGEEIASTTLEATDEDCPMLAFFDEGEETQIEYASADKQLRQFVQKYVAP
ncbi:MAG TPA: hypothetical protein VHJ82_00585 [Actinomycetota bacterium]|nr:hypothetical protein [Actinomycetota bacterium]